LPGVKQAEGATTAALVAPLSVAHADSTGLFSVTQRVFITFTDDANGPLQASASYGECETVPVISPLVGQVFSNPFPGVVAGPVRTGQQQ
jgi:hypothetical protein